MHGLTRGSIFKSGPGRLWLIALCVCGAALSTAAYADDDKHRGNDAKYHGQRSEWRHGRHFDRRHDGWRDGRHDGRHDDRRDWNRRSWHDRDRRGNIRHFDGHRDPHRYRRGSDWHYYSGRYWAPARYRGRRCNDFRHHHGVHYHVAVRDYYDYYYPRYRYYGPRPLGANASVIISIPLF